MLNINDLIAVIKRNRDINFATFMNKRKLLIEEKGQEIADQEILDEYGYLIEVETEPTPEEVIAAKINFISTEVQRFLDIEAKRVGYDSILSACSYASSNGAFGAEGQSFMNWRSAVWSHLYQLLDEIQRGLKTEPTLDEILFSLPTRVVPN